MPDTPKYKLCRKCGLPKKLEEFNNNKNTKDGKESYCRPCKTLVEKERQRAKGVQPAKQRDPTLLEKGLKECFGHSHAPGENIFPLHDFSPSETGYGGRASYCKKCMAEKVAASKNRRPF